MMEIRTHGDTNSDFHANRDLNGNDALLVESDRIPTSYYSTFTLS